jgi:6-pyruvoyltetrahydropterin/6-carboxytetrahydropterin synthase
MVRWLGMPDDAKYRTTFRIWKEFRFEAAHQLTLVPPDHKCARLHGHSYRVRVHCAGRLDPKRDWVIDYADISAAARPVAAELDHRNLNDILSGETTAENIAFWFLERLRPRLPCLEAVEVFETPGTGVRVEVADLPVA